MKVPADEQIRTLHWALGSGLIDDWRVAVDGGANLGEWSIEMAARFERVIAFEPAEDVFSIAASRVPENVELRRMALMDCDMHVQMHMPYKRDNHRSRYAKPSESGILATSVDALALESCGLLKLDLEGAEHVAILGAQKTIREHRPLIIAELDGHGKRYGFDVKRTHLLLRSFGYRAVYESQPDVVFAYR